MKIELVETVFQRWTRRLLATLRPRRTLIQREVKDHGDAVVPTLSNGAWAFSSTSNRSLRRACTTANCQAPYGRAAFRLRAARSSRPRCQKKV